MYNPQQTTIYQIKLPQFMINFKSHIVDYIVPQLISLKQIINQQQNSQYVNPLVVLLVIGIVLVGVRNVCVGLFGKREQQNEGIDNRELNGEVNDLKKQLKALKMSFHQLTKEFNNKLSNPSTQSPLQHSQIQKEQPQSLQLLNTLLPLYTTSLTQNKSVVNYVLESQFEVLKELKKFKKLHKNSVSSSGRPSASTIRSKTSDKKIQRETTKSPVKISNLTTASQAKKSQVKNVERSLMSEDNENKITKNNQESLLKSIPKTLKPQAKTVLAPKINKVQTPSISQTKSFEKQQKLKIEQQNNQKTQQLLIPVISTLQTPQTNHKNKVQVQTIIKETQFTQSIETEDNFQMKVHQEISESTTKVQTVQENGYSQNEQISSQFETTEVSLSEPQVFIAPRPPQIKKMMPPMTKPSGRRPPPPPQRK